MTDTLSLTKPVTYTCKVRRTRGGLYVITFGRMLLTMPNVFAFDLVIYITREHTHHIKLTDDGFFCDDTYIEVTYDK